MEEFLKQLKGKKIDVLCGANSTIRGEVTEVKDGILYLRDDEENVAYLAIEKVAVVWELKDQQTRLGFVN